MEFNNDYKDKLMKFSELPTTKLEKQINETKERNKKVVESLLRDEIMNDDSDSDVDNNKNDNNNNPLSNIKPDENNMYKCPKIECGRCFKNYSELENHYNRRHNE